MDDRKEMKEIAREIALEVVAAHRKKEPITMTPTPDEKAKQLLKKSAEKHQKKLLQGLDGK